MHTNFFPTNLIACLLFQCLPLSKVFQKFCWQTNQKNQTKQNTISAAEARVIGKDYNYFVALVGHQCCSRSRRMALGADGVDRPELLALSRPLTAGGVSVLRSEAGANTGTRAGDIGRISGWNGSAQASFTAKSVTGTADVDGSVGLRTDVENGLKVGVVWRCCFCCCSWTMRSAGRRAGDGCGVDSRSRNLTNSSENDWK